MPPYYGMYCWMCGEKLPEGANYCPKCGARTRAGKAEIKLEVSKIEEAVDATRKFIEYVSWALIVLLAIPLLMMGFIFFVGPWEPRIDIFFLVIGLALAITIAAIMEKCRRAVKIKKE